MQISAEYFLRCVPVRGTSVTIARKEKPSLKIFHIVQIKSSSCADAFTGAITQATTGISTTCAKRYVRPLSCARCDCVSLTT